MHWTAVVKPSASAYPFLMCFVCLKAHYCQVNLIPIIKDSQRWEKMTNFFSYKELERTFLVLHILNSPILVSLLSPVVCNRTFYNLRNYLLASHTPLLEDWCSIICQ